MRFNVAEEYLTIWLTNYGKQFCDATKISPNFLQPRPVLRACPLKPSSGLVWAARLLICISEKLNQRVGRFLGPFLQNPMTGVLSTTTVTLSATSFICSASSLPNDLSPPIDSTGMVSFV